MTNKGTNFFTPSVGSNIQVGLADEFGNAFLVKCTVANIPSAQPGFAVGCELVATDTGNHYINIGSTTSCNFSILEAGSLALAEGSIFVGNNAGEAAAVDASTDGNILVGDGTTVNSVAMSGDVTIDNAGATTIANSAVTGAKLVTTIIPGTVSRATNSTTPVNVFGPTSPFSATIDGIFVVSQDTTAGNIIIKNDGATVATIAKGTTAGALVGATSLANTSLVAGDTFTIESDSAGEAFVNITFRVS